VDACEWGYVLYISLPIAKGFAMIDMPFFFLLEVAWRKNLCTSELKIVTSDLLGPDLHEEAIRIYTRDGERCIQVQNSVITRRSSQTN